MDPCAYMPKWSRYAPGDTTVCKQRISQEQFSRKFHFGKHYHYPLCLVADSSDTLLEQFLPSFTVCINRGFG